MAPCWNSQSPYHEVIWPKVTLLCREKDITFFSSGQVLTSCGAKSFIQWHIYKRVQMHIESWGHGKGPVEWFLCSSVNLIWFSFPYAMPSPWSFSGSVPQNPQSWRNAGNRYSVWRCPGHQLKRSKFRTDNSGRAVSCRWTFCEL